MDWKQVTRTDPKTLACDQLADELARRIEGNIQRLARGQIQDLCVVCKGERVILQGRSRTQHAKQLAQEAVLALTDISSVVTNQIVVI